ncbi:hypothetical protein AB3S75_026929 [Citrus x aurantiifolia]
MGTTLKVIKLNDVFFSILFIFYLKFCIKKIYAPFLFFLLLGLGVAAKALFGDYEWYFFCPEASEPNRVFRVGYWEDAGSGTDKIITTAGRKVVGIKKALVFHLGNAPNGTKTNWIMHEYRLFEPPPNNGSSKLDDWIL